MAFDCHGSVIHEIRTRDSVWRFQEQSPVRNGERVLQTGHLTKLSNRSSLAQRRRSQSITPIYVIPKNTNFVIEIPKNLKTFPRLLSSGVIRDQEMNL